MPGLVKSCAEKDKPRRRGVRRQTENRQDAGGQRTACRNAAGQQLRTAVNSIEAEPQYLRLLSTPSVPKRERCALLDKAFEGAHPYLVSFLKLLCEEDLLGELPGCLRAYQDRYNVDHNILEVTAVSAIALTAPSREKLLAKLQKMTGKNIVLTETVDPAVLGGLRLDMDGTRLDGTVQRHLERLRTEIDGAVL